MRSKSDIKFQISENVLHRRSTTAGSGKDKRIIDQYELKMEIGSARKFSYENFNK